jgi:hypothetical protein
MIKVNYEQFIYLHVNEINKNRYFQTHKGNTLNLVTNQIIIAKFFFIFRRHYDHASVLCNEIITRY